MANPAPLGQLRMHSDEVWRAAFASNRHADIGINPGTEPIYQAFAAAYLGDRALALRILQEGPVLPEWPDLLSSEELETRAGVTARITYGSDGTWRVQCVDCGTQLIDDQRSPFYDADPDDGTPHACPTVLPSKPCKICGLRCVAADPSDPESYVHDEDQEFDDHTAEVTP